MRKMRQQCHKGRKEGLEMLYYNAPAYNIVLLEDVTRLAENTCFQLEGKHKKS